MSRLRFALLLVLSLAACSGYDLVEPERRSIGGIYTVDPQIRWNRSTRGHTEIWTIDGPLLQQLRFVKGLEDGDRLFPSPGLFGDRRRERRKPSFHADMTPIEIAEFFESSLSQAGAVNFRISDLRPARFGRLSGFRFSYDYSLADGLERQGLATGALHDGSLLMLIYAAPRMYYFARDKPHVERLIRSIEFPPDGSHSP